MATLAGHNGLLLVRPFFQRVRAASFTAGPSRHVGQNAVTNAAATIVASGNKNETVGLFTQPFLQLGLYVVLVDDDSLQFFLPIFTSGNGAGQTAAASAGARESHRQSRQADFETRRNVIRTLSY